MYIFVHFRLVFVAAPSEADFHGGGKGGLEGLVDQLHPLCGDHEAFVVGGGANLDFNIAKVQIFLVEQTQSNFDFLFFDATHPSS